MRLAIKTISVISMLTFLTMLLYWSYSCSIQCKVNARPKIAAQGPTINDPSLKAELVSQGLKGPSSMIFLGPNDILVTEKDTGVVQRIDSRNGNVSKPLVHLNVSTADERGLLGIAVSNNKKDVFLYYTEGQKIGEGESQVNHVYRYELIDDKLVNPKLILDLPGLPGPQHNGGKLAIGPDNNLYIAIGDVGGTFVGKSTETQAQNYVDGVKPDGRAGILRITQEGRPVNNGIIGSEPILNTYYAYGIKNIFGFDFDPITGKMWDTENGPTFGDEINFIEPGFNSGWTKVQGIWYVQSQEGQITEPSRGGMAPENPKGLVDFGGKGKYRSPEFTWEQSVAPTALRFLNSDKLGDQYKNDMFVGDAKYGNIYHFKLNQNRTGLLLDGPLTAKVAEKVEEMGNSVFGRGFGVITDLQLSPDGYLYVLSYDKDDGRIYKIVPSSASN